MPKRATIYTYPWDLSDEGVDNALNTIADTAGLNSVSLGQSYHVSTYFLAFAAFKGYGPQSAAATGRCLATQPLPHRRQSKHPVYHLVQHPKAQTSIPRTRTLWLRALRRPDAVSPTD